MSRDLHYSAIVVGQKGVGKSTKLATIAKQYHPSLKVLIIDVNGSPAYNAFKQVEPKDIVRLQKGIFRLLGTPDMATLTTIATKFRDGLVIFEDCTKYISGAVHPSIKTFLVDHRMYNCDLIFTFHSLKRVPPFFWEMISYCVLFKTAEVFENPTNKFRIPNYENMLKAFNEVKANKDLRFNKTVETLI